MTTQCMIEGTNAQGNVQCFVFKAVDERKRWGARGRGLGGILISSVLGLAVISSLLISATMALPALLGLKGMIVISGSMEPAVNVGDIAMIRRVPSEPISVGDVITFRALGGTGMTSHRVIATKEIEGQTYFQTRGDANDSADPNLVPAGDVYGKAVWVEPKVGYLVLFATSFWGKLLMIILPLFLALGLEMRDLLRRGKARQRGIDLGSLGGHRGASMPS